MEYQNFTSLPPEQEQSFVVYERTSAESLKKAMTLGLICGAVVGVFMVILFFSYEAPINAHAVEPETDLAEEVAPAPKAAAAPAPAPEPVAEEAATEEAAPAMEAPEPPKGATKAPTTDLIK